MKVKNKKQAEVEIEPVAEIEATAEVSADVEAEAEDLIPEATVPKTPTDFVKFNVYEDMSAPTVGNYSIHRELGIPKLLAKHTYEIPRNVAEVLVDSKKGVIL